jgi:hypothetical protein
MLSPRRRSLETTALIVSTHRAFSDAVPTVTRRKPRPALCTDSDRMSTPSANIAWRMSSAGTPAPWASMSTKLPSLGITSKPATRDSSRTRNARPSRSCAMRASNSATSSRAARAAAIDVAGRFHGTLTRSISLTTDACAMP